ncbi:MAG: amidohydrolase, partial [Actinobacteria bacterium]|nr:amidohydrolase [Actinomycetota bacterium]
MAVQQDVAVRAVARVNLAAIERNAARPDEFEREALYASARTELDRLGVAHRRVVGTGVVAVLGSGERCIAVRADIDALPVPEAPGREGYRSENPGMSHACGHDAHVAIVLGLAELLWRAGNVGGRVALYFQPAEEGPGGAEPMVAEGVLDDPVPEAVVALHVASEYPTGTIALRAGPNSGSDDTIRIVVRGEGGHAAYPYLSVDPIPVAAQIITAVQQVISREVNPVHPVVCTFGSISGGSRHNVIAP